MFRRIKSKSLRYSLIVFCTLLVLLCAIETNFLWLFGFNPSLDDIKRPNMRIASEVYTCDGKLIGRYFRENRSPVDYQEIPKNVINALVATEDARFYKHHGIDLKSTIGSILSTAQGDKRGASTITQQLAKNLYRTRTQKFQGLIHYIPILRTLVYKIKEWSTALKLEWYYSKQEILTLYLNTVPFGNNAFGIKTASKFYFSKNVNKLNINEAAMLIGMLKATSTYNPLKNPTQALERRNIVLTQMVKYHYLSAQELKKLKKKPLKLKIGQIEDDKESSSYLRDAVARWLSDWCDDNGYDLYEDGLKIYTTIDSRLQTLAEEAINEQMKALQRRLNNAWGNENPWRDSNGNEMIDYPLKAAQRLNGYTALKEKFGKQTDSINYYLNKPKRMTVFTWNGEKDTSFSTLDSIKYYAKFLNTGMMTLNPFNGHIKVWVGGINHKFFKYDHVNQAKRQAGSTFKPFAYLTALDNGYNPCDKFTDKPISITYEEDGEQKIWEPKNSDYHFSGREMSLRWAMAKSVNSITAQLTQLVGWNKIVEYAHKCGIESDLKAVPSVSLGSNDVSIFEMVKAYGTFLNQGKKTTPLLVEHIEDNKGKTLIKFNTKEERVLSEETAWLMLYMFKGGMEEPEGTSQALWEWDLWNQGNEIGGKTGTSSNYVDGWYMGITKDLITGVWVGADERSVHFKTSQTGEGSRTALPIFGKFMEKVYRNTSLGYTKGRFPKPTVDITKDYYCPSPRIKSIKKDTLQTDSTKNEDILIDEHISE